MPEFKDTVELYAGTKLSLAVNRILHDIKIEALLEKGLNEESMRESNKYRMTKETVETREQTFFSFREVAFMSDDELSSLSWPHALLLMSLVQDEAASLLYLKLSWCKAAAWRDIPTWGEFHSIYRDWDATRDQRFLEARGRFWGTCL